jgi:hypothetical protein
MTDRADHALALIDRAAAAGMTLKPARSGISAFPARRLDPNMERELAAAHGDVLLALRAGAVVKAAIRRARSAAVA